MADCEYIVIVKPPYVLANHLIASRVFSGLIFFIKLEAQLLLWPCFGPPESTHRVLHAPRVKSAVYDFLVTIAPCALLSASPC